MSPLCDSFSSNMYIEIFAFVSFSVVASSQADVQEIVSGNNLFVSSVYKEIIKNEKGNFLVSPYSTETILALTQLGAKDETAQEIRSALHLPNDQGKIESGFKTLQTSLRSDKDYILKTANKLYIRKNFTIRSEFKKISTDVFDADSENIDFSKQAEAAKAINTWVEKNTENKIKDLISPNDIKVETVLILINALYFQGNWTFPFDAKATRKENFHTTDKNIIQTDMMHEMARHHYYESQELNAKFLEMSFKGQNASMTFVLPNNIDGISSLEKKIEKVFVSPKYKNDYLVVALPKFRIESKIDFKSILQNLGVSKAFSFTEADLSGIAGQKHDLKIDKVQQKTFIDVNEAGVEAAAATFVSVVPRLAPFTRFIADHPFIFYIKVKDVIIFAGRVVSHSL